MIVAMASPSNIFRNLRRRTAGAARRLVAPRAWLAALALFGTVVATPTRALAAASGTDEESPTDGRLEGFTSKDRRGDSEPLQVTLETTTYKYYLLLIILVIVGMAALFKDAKRTHLD
jgi:hypothetical protein